MEWVLTKATWEQDRNREMKASSLSAKGQEDSSHSSQT